MKKAFTLLEVLIVIVLMFVLISAVTAGFIAVLEAWASQDAALEIREDLSQGMEKMIRDLRLANDISGSDNDAIRFTVNESGVDTSYIFYLYNEDDPWNPAYTQDIYQIRKAPLSGGIESSFTYGAGSIYIKEVAAPTTSDMSISGNVITLDLTVSKYDETFHLKQTVKPRNL